jgi:hypothetical protein
MKVKKEKSHASKKLSKNGLKTEATKRTEIYSTLPDHTVQTKIEKAYSARLVKKNCS